MQTANRYMKRCSISLIIREMHIKATMRYYLTPVRMAVIKKNTNKKYFQGYKEREPGYTVGRNINCCSHCGKQNAAKSLQSCPTLCYHIDGSPRGSPVPGILQARTLEWVAISFCNAGKRKVKGKSLSRVRP